MITLQPYDYVALVKERDALRAENERLREALMYIANFGDEDTVYMREQMQEIAQQALNEVTP
jgi:hypothetical protein